jgi:hypothetical protein
MDKKAKNAKPQTDDEIRKMMRNDPLGVNKGLGGSMMFCQLKPFEKKSEKKRPQDKLFYMNIHICIFIYVHIHN